MKAHMDRCLCWAKAHRKALICLGLFLGLALFLVLHARVPNEIALEAEYDEDAHMLHVSQTIRWVNRSGLELDCVYLHLYPNAFSTEERAPVLDADFDKAYPEGFSPGGAAVEEVTSEGKPADWTLEGETQTLLRVRLEQPLKDGQRAEIGLRYTLTLPRSRLRFGYSDRDVRLLNAFAVPAYHDGSAWRLEEYTPVGDPFVSETADYTVTLRAPTAYVAAGPGLCSDGEDGVWTFRAKDLREFPLVLSRDYCVFACKEGDMQVKAFAFSEEDARRLAELGARAAGTYAELFGELRSRELLLCLGDFAFGGMEYPSLLLLDDALLRDDSGLLEFVTAHETAHQWWYAEVGSDQARHPWQDESLAEYSTLLYYEARYGRQSLESLYQTLLRPACEDEELQGVNMDAPISSFSTNALYDALVYKKGAAMWHDLRALLGNDGFLRALRGYHRKCAGRIAEPEELLQSLGAQGCQRALEWLQGRR